MRALKLLNRLCGLRKTLATVSEAYKKQINGISKSFKATGEFIPGIFRFYFVLTFVQSEIHLQ